MTIYGSRAPDSVLVYSFDICQVYTAIREEGAICWSESVPEIYALHLGCGVGCLEELIHNSSTYHN